MEARGTQIGLRAHGGEGSPVSVPLTASPGREPPGLVVLRGVRFHVTKRNFKDDIRVSLVA